MWQAVYNTEKPFITTQNAKVKDNISELLLSENYVTSTIWTAAKTYKSEALLMRRHIVYLQEE